MQLLRHFPFHIRILGLIAAIISHSALASFDQDDDGVSDANDNCTLISNPQQYDSNNDGIGNLCDADLNNDGIVSTTDYDSLIQFYLTNNLDADLNEDGLIGDKDVAILARLIGTPPGPFGVTNATLYDRPRILATEQKFTLLTSQLSNYPYNKFWASIEDAAVFFANEIPPCPIDNPGCGAPRVISDYSDSSIRTLGDRLPFMALAYRLTGDTVYLDGVRKWMDALISYNDWASNSDIGSAHILIGMSVAYDWLYDSFSETERQSYRDKMTFHANILSNLLVTSNSIWWRDNYYSNHNYTNTLAIALTAIALYGEAGEADDWIMASENNFTTVLSLLSPDGACQEGASYWGLQMMHLLPYFVATYRYDPQVGVQILENGYFQNAASFRLYASLPDFSQIVDYSDSTRHDYDRATHVLRGLAAIFSDPYAQWLAERIENEKIARGNLGISHWLNMLWYTPEIPQTPPNDLPLYKYFENMGILFARSSWEDDAFWSFHKSAPYQGFHAEALGFYPGSHVQPDEGQFLAWSQGRWLLIEDGYVNLKRTGNHNVLTFNSSGQLGSDSQWFNGAEVYLNGGTVMPVYTSLANDTQYIVTEIAPMYRAAANVSSWQRSFIALQEGYQVIRDDVILNSAGQIDSLVHTDIIAQALDSSSVILNPRDRVPEAFDRSGNGNDGVISGGFTTTGSYGTAIQLIGRYGLTLSGAVDKVAIPSLNGTAFPATGTLSLWLNAGNFAKQGINNIFDYNDPGRDHIYIQTSPGTTSLPISGIEVAFQSANGSGNSFVHNVNLTHNEWHHIVISWDTINNWGQLYVNSALVYSASIADDAWTPAEQLATIGNGFIGSIDEVNLFTRVLDQTEINSLFNLEAVVTDLAGYWSFDGITDAVMPGFREYSYRLVHPANSTLSGASYIIPSEERAGSQGNYLGQLLSTTYNSPGTEAIIHFVGDASTPVSYDSVSNNLSISHDAYSIEIDFDNRSVMRSPAP